MRFFSNEFTYVNERTWKHIRQTFTSVKVKPPIIKINIRRYRKLNKKSNDSYIYIFVFFRAIYSIMCVKVKHLKIEIKMIILFYNVFFFFFFFYFVYHKIKTKYDWFFCFCKIKGHILTKPTKIRIELLLHFVFRLKILFYATSKIVFCFPLDLTSICLNGNRTKKKQEQK